MPLTKFISDPFTRHAKVMPMQPRRASRTLLCAMALLAFGMALLQPLAAIAQPLDDTPVCTKFADRKEEVFGGTGDPAGGLLSEIYRYITEIVDDATEVLFNTFTDSTAYQNAVGAAFTLAVLVFGVGFTIGVVQASFGQVLVRLFKFGIIMTLISPVGWKFFSYYMVGFFNNGTDEMIMGVLEIGTGVTPPAGATPFYQFDRLAEFIIQPDTIVAIMGATLGGGPYGIIMGSLMAFAFWGFIKLLVAALRMYAVAYIGRALLLGIAPIFFVFLLFDRTKNLFVSWVNSLLNMSLQPILLFTFLSFFMVLLETASKDMLSTEFCWTDVQGGEGSVNSGMWYAPVDPDTNAPVRSESTWAGALECLLGSDPGSCKEFPINVIDILTFLILVFLATRFAEIIDRIASELSNAFITLDSGGKMDEFLKQGGGKGGGGGAIGGIGRGIGR